MQDDYIQHRIHVQQWRHRESDSEHGRVNPPIGSGHLEHLTAAALSEANSCVFLRNLRNHRKCAVNLHPCYCERKSTQPRARAARRGAQWRQRDTKETDGKVLLSHTSSPDLTFLGSMLNFFFPLNSCLFFSMVLLQETENVQSESISWLNDICMCSRGFSH